MPQRMDAICVWVSMRKLPPNKIEPLYVQDTPALRW